MASTDQEGQEIVERLAAHMDSSPETLVAELHTCALTLKRPPTADEQQGLLKVARQIGRLARVEPKLLGAQVEALLVSEVAALGLQWMQAAGALGALLPEVAAMVDFHKSSPKHHKDLWDHTLIVLERVPAEIDLRWVALYHDVGKVATRALNDEGELCFLHHEVLGARYFHGVAARLGLPPERATRVSFVIEHHARTNQFDPTWTDKALRRLVRECGEHLPLMLAFSSADWTTKKKQIQKRIAAQHAELRRRLAALSTPELMLPKGFSESLMALSGQAPGPWLREARQWLASQEAAQIQEQDGESWAKRYLAWAQPKRAKVLSD